MMTLRTSLTARAREPPNVRRNRAAAEQWRTIERFTSAAPVHAAVRPRSNQTLFRDKSGIRDHRITGKKGPGYVGTFQDCYSPFQIVFIPVRFIKLNSKCYVCEEI